MIGHSAIAMEMITDQIRCSCAKQSPHLFMEFPGMLLVAQLVQRLVGYYGVEGPKPLDPSSAFEVDLHKADAFCSCFKASPGQIVHGRREVEQRHACSRQPIKHGTGQKARPRAQLQNPGMCL